MTTEAPVLLDIQDLTKTYPGAPAPVLRGVSLALEAGDTLALTGESGSGKSTLLHLVGALDGFDSGEIRLDGTALSGLDDRGRARLRRDTVALVFQQFNLMPALTVDQNLAFHARLAGRSDPGWIGTIRARLGLDGLGGRYPEALSGGQQQRVAIGRALAMRPRLLLADEPTGNLDQKTAQRIIDLLFKLNKENGTTLIMVTHDNEIAKHCDRQVVIAGGQISLDTE